MNCKFCSRNIENPGSLKAHEMSCANNPNRVKHKHSDKAGAQKGNQAWNAGKEFTEENIKRSEEFFANGNYKESSETVSRRHAKRLLIHLRGHKCEICEVTEWMGKPVPLVCDHINGDSTDNRFENFRNVCANCDAQLPTFKSKNRGRGRKYDREKYDGGASRLVTVPLLKSGEC